MIQLALRMYHVPEVMQVMLDDYFIGFRMRFSTNNYTTSWINLEVGIAMGCTISPILFVMAMEVILKAAEGSVGPANLGGGCSMPPLKAFMDDTTVICSKEDETRRMLTRLDDLMSWCRMEFKPKESRSLSIRRGKADEATTFTVAEQQIPTVSQEPVKSLGRWYDSSTKDTRRGAETLELASESLLAINKCGLQGKFKIWCLQFMLILKLLWPLLLKARHSALSRTESARKKRSQKRKNQERFIRDPFQFARQFLQQPKSGTLTVEREELETHLKKTYSDPTREIPLEETTGLVWPAAPGIKFDSKPPSLQEVIAVVNKARAKSAPGPNGVPYLLYKRCPNVLKKLHKILRSAWKKIKISKEWMTAEGVYIPKEQDSRGINQFRPISLLNVEGKIFFSVMASRLTKYLTENGFINTSVQKGGIPEVSGCLEHAIWEAIQRAKSEKLNLDVVWLDLANAYGSVPHEMIQLALRMYHVPEVIQQLQEDDDGNIEDGAKVALQLLGPSKQHLFPKIFQLVMSDSVFQEGRWNNSSRGRQMAEEAGSTAPDSSSQGRLEDRKADSRHSSTHHISVGRIKTEDTSPAF
ncbi:reverse transcriptase [Plakobranchus ocellatus]|uniref:Reverse transcriptase n=1 Tax=Plakobranchus ocellatus TaxID=259542 RepID=A0AAV3YGF8_9GAST|nr:reverse transcriptase [Plakobranchus ocellatus]